MEDFSNHDTVVQQRDFPVAQPRQGSTHRLEWILFVVACCLMLLSLWIGWQWYATAVKLSQLRQVNAMNANVVAFERLFVTKVLQTQGEVVAQDRLALETAVANTNDSEMQQAWQIFLDSRTEEEAQQRTLVLLTLFTTKVHF